jgi:hypothetical protein
MQNKMRKVIGISAIVSTIFEIFSGICAIPFIADLAILSFFRPFFPQPEIREHSQIRFEQNYP